MYVCICNKVTDSDIKRAVRDGACSIACLQEKLAVSTCCGKCHTKAQACLESFTGRQRHGASALAATL